MFSYEERIKAVKLLLQYDMSYSTVIRELGYPTKETLWNWYNEYSQSGSRQLPLARMFSTVRIFRIHVKDMRSES